MAKSAENSIRLAWRRGSESTVPGGGYKPGRERGPLFVAELPHDAGWRCAV